MAQLSDEEIAEAAAEAGVSPAQLRHALAERAGHHLDRPRDAMGLFGPPTQGASEANVEGRLTPPPQVALERVRASIERQSGHSGHRQGDHHADIVDDSRGLTYRIRTADDGAAGALVRIDIDPTAGQSHGKLTIGITVMITMVLVAIGLMFATSGWLFGGLLVGAMGGFMAARDFRRLRGHIDHARDIASLALIEVDEASPPHALPPGSD